MVYEDLFDEMSHMSTSVKLSGSSECDHRCPPTAAGQLMGMNEIAEKLTLDAKCRNEHAIVQRVTAAANLSRVPCGSDRECR